MSDSGIKVSLNVYNITAFQNENLKSALVNMNYFFKDLVGLGGIFHGAIELYDVEISYGYCDSGTGVYMCKPKKNPMY